MYSAISKFACVALFVVAGVSAAPPKSKKVNIEFHTCRKSDPQFQKCYKDEIQRVLPLLGDGYPRFRIPALEPFELPALDIAKGSGAVSIDLSLQKIKVYGLSSAVVNTLQFDPEKLTAYAKLSFTKPISLVGSYVAKGKVQVLPINGKGPCNITLVEPILELTDVQGTKIMKNGVEYIAIKNINLKCIHMKNLILKLDNLFQGNKELSDNLNVFINENWELLFDELKPAFEETLNTVLKEIAGKVFARVPLKDIFPE